MARLIPLVLGMVSATTVASLGRVVDHADVDGVTSLPQSTMDAIGRQKWLFTHASVGGNMINGMSDLRTADPNRYQLVPTSVGYNSSELRASDPPIPTAPGRIYDCSRGNPGWATKFTIFDNSVRVSGWHDTAVEVVMDKLCYIDQAADANQYITMMAALEVSYPETVFVYTTMPLTTSEDSSNVLRNVYNAAVRAYCLTHNRLLYDIADMEAYDPNGTQYTFVYGGQTYQKLYSGYTSDGGHLNTDGRQRIARGWYAVAAVIVEQSTLYSLTLDVINGLWGTVTLDPEPNDANAPSYPAGSVVTLTATPTAGRAFRQWEIYDPNHPGDANFVVIDANNPLTIVMEADREVTACFKCGSGAEWLPIAMAAFFMGLVLVRRGGI